MRNAAVVIVAVLMAITMMAAPMLPSTYPGGRFRIGEVETVSAAVVAPTSNEVQEPLANAWHCSVNAYAWSSGSRIYVQAAIYCPHGHSGWGTAGDYAPNPDRAYGTDIYVAGGTTRYVTYSRWCSPGYNVVVAPYGLFSSGGVVSEDYEWARHIWCSY